MGIFPVVVKQIPGNTCATPMGSCDMNSLWLLTCDPDGVRKFQKI